MEGGTSKNIDATTPVAVAGGLGVIAGSVVALLVAALFVPDVATALSAELPSGLPQ